MISLFKFCIFKFTMQGVLLSSRCLPYINLQASVPSEAIADVWTNSNKMSWGAHLCSSLSAGDLLQVLVIPFSIMINYFWEVSRLLKRYKL